MIWENINVFAEKKDWNRALRRNEACFEENIGGKTRYILKWNNETKLSEGEWLLTREK